MCVRHPFVFSAFRMSFRLRRRYVVRHFLVYRHYVALHFVLCPFVTSASVVSIISFAKFHPSGLSNHHWHSVTSNTYKKSLKYCIYKSTIRHKQSWDACSIAFKTSAAVTNSIQGLSLKCVRFSWNKIKYRRTFSELESRSLGFKSRLVCRCFMVINYYLLSWQKGKTSSVWRLAACQEVQILVSISVL